MHFAELLQAVGHKLQLDDLKLNDQGVCRLMIGDALEINIEHSYAEEKIHLYSTLGKAPDTDREAFFTRLLEAQHFASEIGEGCAFGLDSQTGDVLLHRQISAEHLTESSFEEALNIFVNWSEYWQQKLSGQEPTDEPEGSTPDDFAASMFIRG
jgi:hypothetical protein